MFLAKSISGDIYENGKHKMMGNQGNVKMPFMQPVHAFPFNFSRKSGRLREDVGTATAFLIDNSTYFLITHLIYKIFEQTTVKFSFIHIRPRPQ